MKEDRNNIHDEELNGFDVFILSFKEMLFDGVTVDLVRSRHDEEGKSRKAESTYMNAHESTHMNVQTSVLYVLYV